MRNPYSGRRPKVRPEGQGKALRKGEHAPKTASHDTGDAYLSGRAGGTAHPYFDRGGKKR
jgi:hypothetical protein